MKLTLRIENLDYLPDGGPLEVTALSRGIEVGRDPAMDWTLPDTNRHISSRHFEVVFRDRQFWLNDVSTNGTFVYGASMRVSSPLQLTHNDRLQVGQYIIRVLIEDPSAGAAPLAKPAFASPPPPQPAFAPLPAFSPPAFDAGSAFDTPATFAAAPASDPWSIAPTAPPMPMPAPTQPMTPLAGQFGDSFIENPRRVTAPPQEPPPVIMAPPPVQPELTAPPVSTSEPFPTRAAATAPSPPTTTAEAMPLLEAICKGAGLPAGSLANVDVTQLGEEIGRSLRIATEELMALLGARAAAKQFVKSASRTMIGGMNNSPLKFKPNATEALLTMFAQRGESYLPSTVAYQQGFDDIKRHQTAVYAAMQPALARLLADLSPESIEERSSGGLMGSKKARAWELFVERWDAKTHPFENGMLDVFLAYFADAYDVAVKKTGG